MSTTATAALCRVPEDKYAMRTNLSVEEKASIVQYMSLRRALDAVLVEHRTTLLSHTGGVRSLGCELRTRDSQRSGFLSLSDFTASLFNLRLSFPASDLILLGFDSNSDGTVDYEAYLSAVVGEMPAPRLLWIERLWEKLATIGGDATGHIDITAIVRSYKAPNGESLSTFLDAWDTRKAPFSRVSFSEFVEWFAPQSASISKDVIFEQKIKQEWTVPSS